MHSDVGMFGKIPAQGDFIERNLQRSFSLLWDDWLQRCLACSRERLADNWLDVYLSSAIWRFCLSPGAVDSAAWAGILMPSVDSVGRYYPLTLAQPIASDSNFFEFLLRNKSWFSSLETAAMTTLQGAIDADALHAQLLSLRAPAECTPGCCAPVIPVSSGWVVRTDDTNAMSSYSQLLHHTLAPRYSSLSIWWSGQSRIMEPTCVQVQGLPTPEQFCSMLSGDWRQGYL